MYIVICLIAYLLGSIPFALIIGKRFYNVDIREMGSGNLGTTNTFRILGKKAGILVFIGDFSKGLIATLLPALFNSDIHPLLVGLFAILGHSFPLFAKFKGGKSVATSAGVILGFSPLAFIFGVISFFLSLNISKYVSFSSVVSSVNIFFVSLFIGDIVLILFSFFVSIFIFLKHKENFKRIKAGTEPTINWP